ncbi:MAG TPA: phosphatase PAP2 family protein [Candidatus Nanopusillus sp.]|nr:phosphatase PAP2 family protein [Candidatus Nanopusillus sp.]
MNLFGLLSDILIGILVLDAIRNYLKNNKNITKKYITYFVFLLGFVYTLKFIFSVTRHVSYFDPFSFPSGHTTVSIILFAVYRNPIFLLYSVVVGLLRILGGYHSFMDVFFGLFFGLVGIAIVDVLEKKIGKEAHRKLFHIGIASYTGFLLYINQYFTTILLVISLTIGLFLYSIRTKCVVIKDLLEWYDRDFTGQGAFTLILGILLVSLLWDKAYISAFFLAWVDGLSTIFGKLFGTREKSIYGLVGGIIGGIIASLATKVNFFIGFVTAFIEYLIPKEIDDNVIIPLVVYLTYIMMYSLL